MKKLLALTLSVIMAASMLVGCGSKPADSDAAEAPAAVESDLQYITDKGEMIIGMTLFAPMDYYEGEELVGFEVDFGKAVCEKLGVTPKFVEIDWSAKEVELSSKNIDCIWNGMTITDERKANMSVSNPYMTNKQVMVAKKDKADSYKESIADALVVAEAGSAGEELATADTFFADAKFTPVDSMAKALMDVASGTSDIAIVDYVTSIGSIGEGTDYTDLVVVDAADFSPEEYGIAFRKGSDVTEKINAIISELVADGTLAEIAAKYKLTDVLSAK